MSPTTTATATRVSLVILVFSILAVYLTFPIDYSKLNQIFNSNSTTINETMAGAVSRSVVKQVLAIEQKEGMGATVRRSIGSMSLRNLSPFLMLDHFHLKPGGGFPDHPHRGQSTVTYLIEGASMHEDSAGHKGTIKQGGVQWMTAGKGIIHAEIPVHGPGLPNPTGLQLWVDIPKGEKLTAPTYQELDPEQIPSAYPQGEDGPVQIKLISGESFGVSSPVRPVGGCWYMHIFLKKKGAKVFQPLPAGWTSFLYTLKGKVLIDSENDKTVREPHHTLVFSANSNETGVAFEALEDDTQGILIAGEPLDQPVVQHGPFVMTTREEIQQTMMDYYQGRNGFEKAHTWKSGIGREFLEKYGDH